MILDILLSVFVLIFGAIGYRKGFFESASDFINLFFSLIMVLLFYNDFAVFLSMEFRLSGVAVIIISMSAIFIVSLFVLRFITRVILFLTEGSNQIQYIDKWLGLFFGVFRGTVLVIISAWFFDTLISSKLYSILQSESQLLVYLEPYINYIRNNINLFA
jgi:membrane protein required for colicin V production